MRDDGVAPIIVKKKQINAAGHHGGAWKIAYADFVTAMMAFFLLMWLINMTSPDQKTGIANFFTPSNARPSGSGAGGILGGTSIMADGLARAAGTPARIVVSLPNTTDDSLGGPQQGEYSGTNVTEILDALQDEGVDVMRYPEVLADLARQTDAREVLRALEADGIDVLTHPEIMDQIFEVAATPPSDVEGSDPLGDDTAEALPAEVAEALSALAEGEVQELSEAELDALTESLAEAIAAATGVSAEAAAEQAEFHRVEAEIRQSLETIPELEPFRDNLRIEQTPEGLRIQIVDAEDQAMFPSGSAAMEDPSREMVDAIAQVIQDLPNHIVITGHTDSRPFQSDDGYSNWELSTDRANSARRALIAAGIPEDRIARVVGRADRDPLDPADTAAAINRRISFVVLSELPQADGTPDTGGEAIEGEIGVNLNL
jgi:chemotaxis protein MotB